MLALAHAVDDIKLLIRIEPVRSVQYKPLTGALTGDADHQPLGKRGCRIVFFSFKMFHQSFTVQTPYFSCTPDALAECFFYNSFGDKRIMGIYLFDDLFGSIRNGIQLQKFLIGIAVTHAAGELLKQ